MYPRIKQLYELIKDMTDRVTRAYASKLIADFASDSSSIEILFLVTRDARLVARYISEAIERGDISTICDSLLKYLEMKPSFSCCRKRYNRALVIKAAMSGNFDIFNLVLESLDFRFKSKRINRFAWSNLLSNDDYKGGASVVLLKTCCENPDPRFVQAVLTKAGNVLCVDKSFYHCLEAACKNNLVDAVKFFIDKFNFGKEQEMFGIAMSNDSSDVMGVLIERYGSLICPEIGTSRAVLHRYYSKHPDMRKY